jgi:prepilin-type processing-associated H-X9-DG protein
VSVRKALVVAVVVLCALALLFWKRGGPSEDLTPPSDVALCTENLRAIYAGLLEYQRRFGHLPEHEGVAFIGALIADGLWEDTHENRARLTCPGPDADSVPPDTDYKRLADLTCIDSAYAIRDFRTYPLTKFPAGGAEFEPLLACDNGIDLNHRDSMNVLYSDGSVRVITLASLRAEGRLRASDETIPVGKDSPVEDLRKLVGDETSDR